MYFLLKVCCCLNPAYLEILLNLYQKAEKCSGWCLNPAYLEILLN